MKIIPLLCLLAFWLAPITAQAAASAPSAPASTCQRVTPLPQAAETFTVGTLRVQRYGDHGRPVILIPGLGSGSWVWAEAVRHLRNTHVVYALTLAGFNGLPLPAQQTGLIDQADASLLKLIQSQDIDHPVLIGHSLGGTLALRFVGEHSDLLGGVVAVDGLPVFPGADELTPEQRHARAQQLKQRMVSVTPAQFKARQLRYMQYTGVLDPAAAACYAKLNARSDPVAMAQYAAEDYASDFRSGLQNAAVPILEISPYYAPDFKKAAKYSDHAVMTAKAKADYYRKLLADAPQAKVLTISPARHFVMLDQPQKFMRVLDTFLSGLPEVKNND